MKKMMVIAAALCLLTIAIGIPFATASEAKNKVTTKQTTDAPTEINVFGLIKPDIVGFEMGYALHGFTPLYVLQITQPFHIQILKSESGYLDCQQEYHFKGIVLPILPTTKIGIIHGILTPNE